MRNFLSGVPISVVRRNLQLCLFGCHYPIYMFILFIINLLYFSTAAAIGTLLRQGRGGDQSNYDERWW